MSNTKKVHFGQKVAFGLGMLANQMFPAAMGIFFVVLVRRSWLFNNLMWAVLYFAQDCLMQLQILLWALFQTIQNLRWGRRRQYVLLVAFIMGISFIIMWQLYKDNGLDYNFYLLSVYGLSNFLFWTDNF